MFSRIVTWMEDSRPRKWTLEVTFRIDSDVEVENTKILHLSLKKVRKKRIYQQVVNMCFSVIASLQVHAFQLLFLYCLIHPSPLFRNDAAALALRHFRRCTCHIYMTPSHKKREHV